MNMTNTTYLTEELKASLLKTYEGNTLESILVSWPTFVKRKNEKNEELLPVKQYRDFFKDGLADVANREIYVVYPDDETHLHESYDVIGLQDDGTIVNLNLDSQEAEERVKLALCDEAGTKSKTFIKQLRLFLWMKGRKIPLSKCLPVGFKDSDDGYFYYKHLPFTKDEAIASDIKDADLPAHNCLLSTLQDDEERHAFKVFIGSLFNPESRSHQYLHLSGSGGDGKSAIVDGLTNLISKKYCTTASASDFGSSAGKFALSKIENKVLCVFQDENHSSFMSSGNFKKITGNQHFTIGIKHKSDKMINIQGLKVIIISNSDPAINNSEADKRRLIAVSINNDLKAKRPHIPDFDLIIESETEDFVKLCVKEYYTLLATNPETISHLPSPSASANAAIERHSMDYDDILSTCELEITDTKEKIKRSDMFKLIREKCPIEGRAPAFTNKFQGFLEGKGCIIKKSNGHHYVFGLTHKGALENISEEIKSLLGEK